MRIKTVLILRLQINRRSTCLYYYRQPKFSLCARTRLEEISLQTSKCHTVLTDEKQGNFSSFTSMIFNGNYASLSSFIVKIQWYLKRYLYIIICILKLPLTYRALDTTWTWAACGIITNLHNSNLDALQANCSPQPCIVLFYCIVQNCCVHP